MLTRRDFIIGAAAALTALPDLASPMLEAPLRPLRVNHESRTLVVQKEPDGRCLIVSDGPKAPRNLIRRDAIDRVFGAGVYDSLCQRDHWRMIDAGWFAGDDLFMPVPLGDPAYLIWCARHRPENEAHDLLSDLFLDRAFGPFGVYIPEFGLTLAEHPNTPRYATARLDSEYFLPSLAEHASQQAPWLSFSLGRLQNPSAFVPRKFFW